MARLSTHVLDTSRGVPASGVKIEVYTSERTCLGSMMTNADGRIEEKITLSRGVYELVFHVGDYFGALYSGQPDFLDQIVVRFGISDPDGKYHVPLLVSPYGYSTYRGS
jgi:5-hydroxyisourate hydrolase